MACKKSKSTKRANNELETDYAAIATENAEGYLADAYDLIVRFEHGEEDDFVEPIDEENLLSELNYIRDKLDDCADDGWDDYRDAMDALSNRLWKIGVAWPQYLPPCSWADEVHPEDVKKEITETALYREDLLAIRSYGDSILCRFKDAVHLLVEHARKTVKDFPPKEKPSKKCKKKTGNGAKSKISRKR